MQGTLVFKDGTKFEGRSFGYEGPIAGEVVFGTGMVGYPEAITDPSFEGQILVMTYPIIGNYGVPDKKFWESDRVHTAGLIVSDYIDTPSHWQNKMTLSQWLKEQKVPALEIKDTRILAQYLRDNGSQLGKIIFDKDIPFYDPNEDNLVAKVSPKDIVREGEGNKTIVLIDCGAKRNMHRCLLKRGVKVVTVPWDYDPFEHNDTFDALIISNGPGDPKMVKETIDIIKKALDKKIPTMGVCLGNQLLALAAGGNTSKLKFGHRSQNQPAIEVKTKKCYITSQNHGFAVSSIPKGFSPWFINANDGSNEGIIHDTLPFMSAQFHPEANPGPIDTEWIFDYFLERIQK
ncbi:MAG TPA: glutamine-hydrolyzing carbamoyl-phosphate synthase small subunit [Candidatus Saccharimonadales bacterium]|nr:glutamine-hydrolyzing carbamoyl-phosphate synthase small subunit [Candidatus Saccharimonadales bacterium]